MLQEAAAMLKGIMSDEQSTSIQVRQITEGTSVMGGSIPTTGTTLVATTTGLVQELTRMEAVEAGLLGERRGAQVFLVEYAALEAGTHVLRWSSLDWEVRVVRQYVGAYTMALAELMGDG